MMEGYRLIHRVTPHEHEDVVGFLMRVAERNHVGGPAGILSEVFGTAHTMLQMRDLPKLAHHCRNSIEELAQLSGIVQRLPDGTRAWQVAGEWISRPSFVSTRKARVCARCLRESCHIRGLWCLSFYTVCARHELRMVDRCQRCERVLRWNRRFVQFCSCGFHLADTPAMHSSGPETSLAQLIAHHTDPAISILPSMLPTPELERLAGLSLDGLCKTVWFLGHCLGELGQCGVGHGRIQPTPNDADRIIGKAFELLQRWPVGLGERLVALAARKPSATSASLLERLFGPMQHFLREELQSAELAFLRATYEQHIQMMWRIFGQNHRLRSSGQQLGFDFD